MNQALMTDNQMETDDVTIVIHLFIRMQYAIFAICLHLKFMVKVRQWSSCMVTTSTQQTLTYTLF